MTPTSGPPDARVLILTDDDDLAVTALAAAAAVDVPAVHERDPAQLARPWRSIVLGVDAASAAARHGPVGPGSTHLIGRPGDEESLCGWSATLGAAIAVLPDGVRGLSASLAGATRSRAVTLGVVAGVGGAGATTLASALAELAAGRGLRTLLVDLDARGGGIDLALGLERTPGWRWSGFAGARGFVGDLGTHLPATDGVAVLAWDRDPDAEPPGATAIASVLRSSSHTHEVVVVDLPRGGDDLGAAIDLCDGTIVVAPSGVRGLAGARAVVGAADAAAPLALASRPGPLSDTEFAEGLGIPLIGRVPDDRGVRRARESGDSALRHAGRAFRRAVEALGAQTLPRTGEA